MAFRARSISVVLALSGTALMAPVMGGAQTPRPAAGHGFRLYARAFGALTINNVYCGLDAAGEICVDSTGSSTRGGGFWPKNSPQQYVFNSGLQVAGTIQDTLGWAWAGDTTGGFFFDPKGTTAHGQQVEPIWNYANADDRAHWPAAANVPQGDPSAGLYAPSLRGRPSASEGDIWTLAWEGDPALSAGRPHPLGIAIETRILGWSYPRWNNDVIYLVHTLYNVSSSCPADYASVRPGLRETLLTLGQRFQILNEGRFGVQIPDCGYAINELWVNWSADEDVSSDAGNNYSSANIPMALGYSYNDSFRRTEGGYALPADLGSSPFMNAYGFVGLKYLQTPAVGGIEPGIQLFSATVGGASFNDPQNIGQLYRYMKGEMNPTLGDGLCNYLPAVDHICFVKSDSHSDTRSFQSTGPVAVAPGASVTIVTAYLFASPVAIATCATPGCASVTPGDPRHLADAAFLTGQGANRVDSIAGFQGYVDDNADAKVQASEFRTVHGSLMGKAQLAQAIFDSRFLLPSAPTTPDFFLVPGDDQVAIFWRPSATETTGEPFFTLASNPSGPAYDPNFRQFDVEGYRIYRGRVDDPSGLALVAQFDYANTTMRDYLGALSPRPGCAPELGRNSTAKGCPVNFSTPTQGNPYTVFATYDIVSPFVQVRLGDRALLIDSSVVLLKADTAITGQAAGHPALTDNGVPFVYVDKSVHNNLRYFYAVTAFDVNSIQSGPSSFESPRVTKSVVPMVPGSNYDNDGKLALGVFGRGVNMSVAIAHDPGINGTTGVFTGPSRPATGATIAFMGTFIKQVVTQSGEVSLTLDSMATGSAYDNTASSFWFTLTSPTGTTSLPVSIVQSQFEDPTAAFGTIDGGPIDPSQAQRYGGTGDYRLSWQYSLRYPGNYHTASFGRGCQNAASGFRSGSCNYGGARWFDGAAESFPHPTRGNQVNNSSPSSLTLFTNAGSVAGVTNIFEARSYVNRPNVFRTVEGVLGTVATAADYKFYWGTAGAVDSVVDVTHNVVVPFNSDIRKGYTWGFLTQAGSSAAGSADSRPGILSVSDLGCVLPIKTFAASAAQLPCSGATYSLVSTAALGPLTFGVSVAEDGANPPRANPGVGIYLAGHFFLFEMPTLPPTGTTWTMRSYVGAINGGGGAVGAAGDQGAYSFSPVPSPFTAVGATLKATYTVTNVVRAPTISDLDRVHTVPDPYYVTNAYETDPRHKVIKFVELPTQAIIRIYSASGILVRVIEHNSSLRGGEEDWDVRNSGGRLVASGVYFYHIESADARRAGRMTIVTYGR